MNQSVNHMILTKFDINVIFDTYLFFLSILIVDIKGVKTIILSKLRVWSIFCLYLERLFVQIDEVDSVFFNNEFNEKNICLNSTKETVFFPSFCK